jgi:hypothetical protein
MMIPASFARISEETARRFNNEKWTRHTLDNAGIRAVVFDGVVYVKNETDELRARSAMKANVALNRMPIKIKSENY